MKREKGLAMGRIGLGVALGTLLALLVVDGSVVGRDARADSDVPGANPLSGDQKAIAEGRSWFRATCSVCHGGRADGAGERGQGADLRVFSKGFRRFVETVKNGKDTGRTMKMPAWGRVLSEEQIYQIGAYLETLAIEGANWKAPTK
jgi:mono/diheme cytochrome c family protein